MSDAVTSRLADRVAAIDAALRVRRVADSDASALTALIAAAYDEYDCGPLDPVRFDADLASPASSAVTAERAWWVITGHDERVVASVAHGPLRVTAPHGATVELHRLYLSPDVRGRGLATSLVEAIAEEALRVGAARLAAWSDTRLIDAHRRYLTWGFRSTGAQRELGDPAGTTELEFERTLRDGAS